MINFVAGGMMGDFIQSLYAVKNICQEKNDKANLYLANEGDVWKHGINKAYQDLRELMVGQSYINQFGIKPDNFNEPHINLNTWRTYVGETGGYRPWSELLSQCYQFNIPTQSQWITAAQPNPIAKNKIVIHRSLHRHNNSFPWQYILNQPYQFLFLTSSPVEYHKFPYKNSKLQLCQVNTINELANIIASCDMFVGNQSAPFSIACALDVPRLVELDIDPAKFYMGEEKYSHNISWFLNNQTKYNSKTNEILV